MSRYLLPQLPYDHASLEPHVSGKVMELHHGKHHAAYVHNANTALDRLDLARAKEDFTRIAALERSVAFNLSGHILHSIFWRNLTPQGGGEPSGELAEALRRDFGGFDRFRRQFVEVAGSIMGLGLGGPGLGTGRGATADHADLRPPVEPEPKRGAPHGSRRVGARLLPQVPGPEGGVLR